MRRPLRERLTYANVVASLALFLAFGGGAIAATQLAKNSVGSRQLRKNSVTSPKVKDGSLLAQDFKPGQLPTGKTGKTGKTGERGKTGPKGPPGPPGAPGATNTVVRYGPNAEIADGDLGLSNALCHEKEVATGGGFQFVGELPVNSSYKLTQDRPSVIEEDFPVVPADGTKATGWVVSFENKTGSAFSFRSYALCAAP